MNRQERHFARTLRLARQMDPTVTEEEVREAIAAQSGKSIERQHNPMIRQNPPGTTVVRTGLSGGQILFGLFLCCFGLFPGLIYFLAASRSTTTVVLAQEKRQQ